MTNWMAFRFLGAGKIALLSRLLLLVFVGVPLLLFRCALAVVVGGGVVWAGLAMTAGGTGVFAVAYRPIVEWMHTSPTFQEAWKVALAEMLPYGLNIMLFTVKLLIEVWNGFCPFLAKVVDVIFDLAVRLALMLWNQGILQRMLSWLTRLVIFMVEPVTDALVNVLESLLWAEDWVSDADVDLGGEETAETATCAAEEATEMLLAIVVITLTIFVRYLELLWSLLLPLMYAFFRIVLPRLISFLPDVLELITQFFSIFSTDPAKRVIHLLIEAFPLLVQQVKILICSGGIYGVSVGCLLVSTFLKFVAFWVKNVAGPVVCGGMSFMTGCLWSWIQMKLYKIPCFQCGAHNTQCDCEGEVPGSSGTDGKGGWACTGECSNDKGDVTAPVPDLTPHAAMPSTSTPDGLPSFTARRGGPGLPLLPQKVTRRACNQVVVNGVVRCTGSPAFLRDVPPLADIDTTELVRLSHITASSTAYAPLLVHHVLNADGVPMSYYSHGALPSRGPENTTISPTRQQHAAQRHRLSLHATPGGYGPAALQQKGGAGWSPSRGGAPTWLRIKFHTAKCITAVALVWGHHPPASYNVTFLSGAPRGGGKVVTVNPTCQGRAGAGRADRIPIGTAETPAWRPALLATAGWPALDDRTGGGPLCAPLVATHREVGLLFAALGSATRSSHPPPHVLQQEAQTRMLVVGGLQAPCCTGAQVAHAVHRYRRVVDAACVEAGQACGRPTLLAALEHAVESWRPTSAPVHMLAAHAVLVSFANTVCPQHQDLLDSDWASAAHRGVVHLASAQAWGVDIGRVGLLGFPPVSKVHAALQTWQRHSPTRMHKPSGGLFVHGQVAAQNGLRMWDPCGRCTLMALSDGKASIPTVFYFAKHGTGQQAEIMFTPQSAETGVGRPARVASVTVVFGANSHVPHTMLCTGPAGVGCVNASGHDDSYLHGPPIVPRRFRPGAQNDSTNTPPLASSFAPHVARDSALFFEPHTSDPSQTFYLRFTQRAPPPGPPIPRTDWEAVKQDHFLHASGPNEWVHTLASHAPYTPSANLGGGLYPDWCAPSYYEGELAHSDQWQPAPAGVCQPTAAWYQDPFEGKARAHWSITEVIVDALPHIPANSRRAAQTPDAPRSKLHLLADAMAGRPTIDPAERGAPEPVHSALRRGPPRDSHHSPFPHDIRQMPDPAAEPVISCLPFSAHNQSRRMVCTNTVPLAIAGAAAPPKAGPAGWASGGLAAELGLDASQLQVVRDHAARTIALGDREISNRAILHSLYVLRQAGPITKPPATTGANSLAPAGRNLFGAAEDLLQKAVDLAVDAITGELKSWLQCSTICGPAWDCNLGECFAMMPIFVIQSALQCDREDTTSMPNVFDVLLACLLQTVKWMFEKLNFLGEIAKMIDAVMHSLANAFLSNPKKTACQACAVAHSVADIVSEFAEKVTPTRCFDFLEVGVEMCRGWDLEPHQLPGELITSMYGSIKLAFMLALTLPALAELTLEWGVLFAGTLIKIFPSLLSDSFDIIMWVISSSSVLEMLEPMFEAIDPLMDQLTDSLDNVGNSCSHKTLNKQKNAAWTEEVSDNTIQSGPALGAELCTEATVYPVPSCDSYLTKQKYGALDKPQDANDMRVNGVAESIAGCGCVPKPPDCGGADTGGVACNFKTGEYTEALDKKAKAGGGIKGCPSAGVIARGTPGSSRQEGATADDGEGNTCVMKPLRAQADVTAATPTDIFSDFANSQENYGYALLTDGKGPSARSHFRNLLWEDPNPRTVDDGGDPLAGLRLLGRKDTNGESHFDRESRLVTEGIANFTSLYASMVVAINEAGLPLLAASGWRAEVVRATSTWASASRSLLAGTPGRYDAQLQNSTCDAGARVTIKDPDNNEEELVFKASTWACCRGLWCCVPPLPQDFRFESEWFRWRSRWYSDTLCPYVDSWPKAAMFGIRSMFKLLHDATLTVDRWPLDGALTWLYEQVSFEGNEFPEADNSVLATCLVMNSGYVWMLFALVLTIILVSGPCSDFAIAVALFFADTLHHLLLLLRPLWWCAASIQNLKEKKSV